jgi:hypothetical protein
MRIMAIGQFNLVKKQKMIREKRPEDHFRQTGSLPHEKRKNSGLQIEKCSVSLQ